VRDAGGTRSDLLVQPEEGEAEVIVEGGMAQALLEEDDGLEEEGEGGRE
jgi:hypothetical protein